ncbi:MAG: DUF2293 domain-containing protein [Planctomycetes bacterium]|nr:DUF2293 domain-containing protein [Planctomycetota bacterium]
MSAEPKALQSREVFELRPGYVRACRDNAELRIPPDWEFLPSGSPFLTRKSKELGPHWILLKLNSRMKVYQAKGLYAPQANIQKAKELAAATESKRVKQRAEGAKGRLRKETKYQAEFKEEVLRYLSFAPQYLPLAEKIANDVAAHACRVGAGTVARTQTLDLAQKAELATIAHIRHHFTNYEDRLREIQADQEGVLTGDQHKESKQEANFVAKAFISKHRA